MTTFKNFLNKYNTLITGRASAAIYAILKDNNIHNKNIIVPANICYAAVYPIIYSKNKPLFIDTNKYGNISINAIKKNNIKFSACIIPHMYGNINTDIEKIASFCKENKILLIEDCASSMGATINGKQCGSFGDYGVFSFGYSKTVDLGNGGMIISLRKLTGIQKITQNLPLYDKNKENNLKLLSSIYRLTRNTSSNGFINSIYSSIPLHYKNSFLYSIKESKKKSIHNSLDKLDNIIELRLRNVELYKENIKPNINLKIYNFIKGSVPWRFNILLNPLYKKEFIQAALKQNLPISDWYPVVVDLFNENKKDYPVTYNFEKKIINFPIIDITPREILNICQFINTFLNKQKYSQDKKDL